MPRQGNHRSGNCADGSGGGHDGDGGGHVQAVEADVKVNVTVKVMVNVRGKR